MNFSIPKRSFGRLPWQRKRYQLHRLTAAGTVISDNPRRFRNLDKALKELWAQADYKSLYNQHQAMLGLDNQDGHYEVFDLQFGEYVEAIRVPACQPVSAREAVGNLARAAGLV